MINTLKQKLDSEMEEFKRSYETMEITQVYNDWYIIMFYESYYEFLTYINEDEYSSYNGNDILEWLDTFEKPIGFLYIEWMSCDGAFCMLWDDMIAWLSDLMEEVAI